ncbi:hypothetical protein F5Y16DRAFT_365034 [Xylariaceae sp. FL0255]|nr:hypothetical protein F5Y16DRAFT_365034 [Xylariaceae sp. FL0255]
MSLLAGIPQSEIDYQYAHINENNGISVQVVGTLFTVLSVVSVVLRIIARRVKGAKLWWDDYLAVASLIPLIALDVSSYLSVEYGVGRHLVWVLKTDPENLIKIGKIEIPISVGYNVTMLLAKGAVLTLYGRVFTLQSRWMKYGIISTGVVVVAYFISSTLSIFLECRPLSTIWTAGCSASHGEAVTFASINLITDIALLVLPQRTIWRLNRAWVDRLALSAIFLLGAFATAVSITRLVALDLAVGDAHPEDPVYYNTYTITFTILEPAIVVLCGSLPMLPGLIKETRDAKRRSLAPSRSSPFTWFARNSERSKYSRSYDPKRSSAEAIQADPERGGKFSGSMELYEVGGRDRKADTQHTVHNLDS